MIRSDRLRVTALWLVVLCLCGMGEAGAQAPAVPPPGEQQTADCRRPVFATDQLVCTDPALRALDERLAALLAIAPPPASRWTEPQWQWFQRRSRCAFAGDHGGCAEAAYRERLALLGPPPRAEDRRAVTCDSADIVAVAFHEDRTSLFGGQGEVLGVAWSGLSTKAWTPFLLASRRGQELRLRTVTGASSRCRMERG